MKTKEKLEEILYRLKNVDGIKEGVIASRDGLLLCSTLSTLQHPETFVAMAAAMFGAGEIASEQLGNSIPERMIVESGNGKIIQAGAGLKGFLIVITVPDASIGIILTEMAKALEQIKQALE